MNNELKFMLEYPISWNADRNVYHKVFLANVMQSIIDNYELLVTPTPWPSYGIKRIPLSNAILIAFHSYDNPDNVWTLKESPIIGLYSLDKSGYSGWSDICKNFSTYEDLINSISDKKAHEIIDRYKEKILLGITKYEQPSKDHFLPENFIFFPLQVRTDSVADNTYLDSLEVLEASASMALKLKKYLVVKKHPFCSSVTVDIKLQQLSENNPFFVISNSNITDLIIEAEAVLSANSGVSLEALICGKMVFCFGESEWSKATHMIKNINEIEKIFLREYKPKKYDKLLAFLLSEYWLGFDDIAGIKQRVIEMAVSHKSNIDINQNSMNDMSFKLEKKLLAYQKEYTERLNQIKEIRKDYEYLKNSTQTFVYYTKFKKSPLYYIFSFFRSVIKKLT